MARYRHDGGGSGAAATPSVKDKTLRAGGKSSRRLSLASSTQLYRAARQRRRRWLSISAHLQKAKLARTPYHSIMAARFALVSVAAMFIAISSLNNAHRGVTRICARAPAAALAHRARAARASRNARTQDNKRSIGPFMAFPICSSSKGRASHVLRIVMRAARSAA